MSNNTSVGVNDGVPAPGGLAAASVMTPEDVAELAAAEAAEFDADVGTKTRALKVTKAAHERIQAEEVEADSASDIQRLVFGDTLSLSHRSDYLIKNLVGLGSRVMVAGPPASLKSFVVLDMCCSIASGAGGWAGLSITNRGGAILYIAAEGGYGLQKRTIGWLQAARLDPQALKSLVIWPEAVNLALAGSDDRIAKVIDHVVEATGRPLALLVVDTARRASGDADENSTQVARALDRAQAAATATNPDATLVVVHHPSAAGKSLRGHSSLEGDADTIILVERDREYPGWNENVTWRVTKQKDGPDNDRTFGALFGERVLGRDSDGDPITSLVPRWSGYITDAEDASLRDSEGNLRITRTPGGGVRLGGPDLDESGGTTLSLVDLAVLTVQLAPGGEIDSKGAVETGMRATLKTLQAMDPEDLEQVVLNGAPLTAPMRMAQGEGLKIALVREAIKDAVAAGLLVEGAKPGSSNGKRYSLPSGALVVTP